MDATALNITECSGCGAVYWDDTNDGAMAIAGGCCCFGHPVLDLDRYPSKRAAMAAYPAWNQDKMDRWDRDVERMAMEDSRR